MYHPSDESLWDKPLFNDALLADHKHDYVKKDKKYDMQRKDSCIICGIINKDEAIEGFEVCRTDRFILYLNLYPYTNAHLLISPIEHIIAYEDLSDEDLLSLSILTKKAIKVLKHNGHTDSLNIGWNQGAIAGGSIKHFHIHLVPRYFNEMNFMEIIARTRPFIRSLEDTLSDLQRYTLYFLGKKSFDDVISSFS